MTADGRLSRAAVAAACVALFACFSEGPGAESDANGTPGDAAIRLGTGFPDYVPLEPGQDVDIIEGIQGGFHIWGGFLVRGIDPVGVTISFDLEYNGAPAASVTYQDDLRDAFDPERHSAPEADWQYAYAGVAVILYDALDPDEVSGDPVRISVRVRDSRGVEVSDTIEVRAVCCSL